MCVDLCLSIASSLYFPCFWDEVSRLSTHYPHHSVYFSLQTQSKRVRQHLTLQMRIALSLLKLLLLGICSSEGNLTDTDRKHPEEYSLKSQEYRLSVRSVRLNSKEWYGKFQIWQLSYFRCVFVCVGGVCWCVYTCVFCTSCSALIIHA